MFVYVVATMDWYHGIPGLGAGCWVLGAEACAGKEGGRFMWFIWFILFIVACLPVGRFMLFRTGARDRWLNV